MTILILAGPDYEDLELWYPKLRLEEAGHRVLVAGLGEPEYRGKHGYPCRVDAASKAVDLAGISGLVAPGGWAPDKLRRDPLVLEAVRSVQARGGMIATICHGPWVLISAGVVRGKKLTSTVAIKDDLINAGATWVDAPTVVDGNLISARVPKDLPEMGRAMVEWLARDKRGL